MAFQESGACSASPYKCLYVINSDLYNSMVSNNSRCEDSTGANSASSAYSAPNIQNNFYPSNRIGLESDGGNKISNYDGSTNSPPDIPPPPPDTPLPPTKPQSSDETPVSAESPSFPQGKPSRSPDMISPDQDSGPDAGGKVQDTVSGGGDQIASPPSPKVLNRLKRLRGRRPLLSRAPNIHDQSLSPSQNPHQNISLPSPSPHPPRPESSNNEKLSINPLEKFNGKVKWPSYDERKPDENAAEKKPPRAIVKTEKKPLVKRKTKFERNLSNFHDQEDLPDGIHHQNSNWISSQPEEMETSTEVKSTHQNELVTRFIGRPTHQNELVTRFRGRSKLKKDQEKKPLTKRKFKFERTLPKIDEQDEIEEMDTLDEAKNTHQNELATRFRGRPNVRTDQEKKPLVKRKPKFERSLPKIDEQEELEEMDTTDEVKNTHQNEVVARFRSPSNPKTQRGKKPLVKRKLKFERTLPKIDEEEEFEDEEVKKTHQNEYMMRFNGAPHIDSVTTRKYPQIMKTPKAQARGTLRIRKDLFSKSLEKAESKNLAHLKHKNEIKNQLNGGVRVRGDLFDESSEKIRNRMRMNMFKSTNNSEKKKDKIPPKIEIKPDKNAKVIKMDKRVVENSVKQFFSKNNASAKKRPKSENISMHQNSTKREKTEELEKGEKTEGMEIEHIHVPYMPEHAPHPRKKNVARQGSNRVKNTKRIIENHANAKVGHSLKKELIENMEQEEIPENLGKKKMKSKEEQKSKRKNRFPTHPTGPIKFLKTKEEKPKIDKSDSGKKLKKLYGSGFKLWKL